MSGSDVPSNSSTSQVQNGPTDSSQSIALRDSMAPLNSNNGSSQMAQSQEYDFIRPEDAEMALPRVDDNRDSEDSGNDFWSSLTGGEYGDYLDEDQDNKMSKLKLNSILFAVFQILLVLVFFRAIGAIDKYKFGREYLQKLGQRLNTTIPMQTYFYVYLNIVQYVIQLTMNLLIAFSVWRYMSIKERRMNLIDNLRIQRMELEQGGPNGPNAVQYQQQITNLQWLVVQLQTAMISIKERL